MRILIVEDDEFTAKALATVLSNQHYTVEIATDGQAGWELVEAFSYDLILLDVMLPKLDGISLCRRLRSQGYRMPILLLTGQDSSNEKVTGLDAGADDYVIKPFEQQELIARVRDLLHQGDSTGVWDRFKHRIKDERPLLLIVDSDRQLAERLVIEAATWGLRAKTATNLSVARNCIYQDHPHIVLLDPSVSYTTEDSLTLLAELSNRTPPVPVLVFTAQDNLIARLEVARAGAHAFLQKPVPPVQVLEACTQMLQHLDRVEARVMVVDDDPQILAVLRTLLEPWGLEVTTLDDPRRFWEILAESSPDLLILDVKMPHLSGIELCQVVRNDWRWSGLPVLVITAHTDATIVNQVFAVGADDFVSKPIVGPELVTRIINRLERIKLLRSLAQTDPLTKVSNRHKSTQDLDNFLCLALRHNQPLCLAILDLDHFKQINDRYGHGTGDAVLRQVGQLLQRSFRSEDVVARWGGEEFVVGMYGMTKSYGVQRLTKVLEALRQEEFIALNSTKFKVTFSAGVAQYPEDGTDLQSLYRSADAALYQAKLAGRDRVLPAGVRKLYESQN